MSSIGLHIALLLVSLSSVMCGSKVDRVGGQCLTVGGAQTGVPCVLPFKARGTTYTECTKAGGFDTPWCSTKVDANGDTVLGNWGDCPTDDPDCYPSQATTEAAPMETTAQAGGDCLTTGGAQVGVPCVFPFKARGNTYTSCTFAGGFSTPWCSTKVDANGDTVLGNWGDCPMNDPTCPNDATTLAPETSPAAETSPADETSPAETSPAETSLAETSPAETSPAETSPAETSLAETSPAETSPAETSPAETSPAETSPAETSPAETSPAETSPAETSPAETSPAETSPAETSPAETSLAETSPAETSPAETSPAETSPAETSPAETSPAETSLAETSLAETSPAETSPAETSLAETSPAETSPAETSPAETSPAETSPAETSPAETSPAETSPAETSPSETSPAETSPDATTVAPCMTVSGAQVGVPCIFPFITRETTYTSCTVAGGYSIPWCATKVDDSGTIVMGNWGECALDDPNCPNDITTEAPTTESTTAEIPPDGGAPVRKINFF